MSSILDTMAGMLNDTRKRSQDLSERLATGGTQAPWSNKTSAQIGINIDATNEIERLKEFEKSNKLVESRLKTQLLALDDFMKLARDIQTQFMPGSYTVGDIRTGLAAIQQNAKDRFFEIGNRIDPMSGEYVMGGVATQTPPIKNVMTFAAYTGAPTDYSTPVSGSIKVYINDDGDTVSFTGNDFDAEMTMLYRAIMQLGDSATGSDAASDQASVYAAKAQKALLSKYYEKLEQINIVSTQRDELSELVQQAMELRAEFTEDDPQELLAQLISANVMEDIQRYLFAQQSRELQKAVTMMERGG